MKIEHVAFQVADPVAAARWYVDHLGLEVKRAESASPFGHFLADDGGTVMLEIYCNPAVPVPDYRQYDPRVVHVAFAAPDVARTYSRLIAAGATDEGGVTTNASGDTLAMVRDPWGLAVQLVQRAQPMLG
ncbi:MAG: VOC family protein [Vicinamibacterales bacterium]